MGGTFQAVFFSSIGTTDLDYISCPDQDFQSEILNTLKSKIAFIKFKRIFYIQILMRYQVMWSSESISNRIGEDIINDGF
jgi:hypothetical protein